MDTRSASAIPTNGVVRVPVGAGACELADGLRSAAASPQLVDEPSFSHCVEPCKHRVRLEVGPRQGNCCIQEDALGEFLGIMVVVGAPQ